MPHQQKLVHIQDVTGVPPGGGLVQINPGLRINTQSNPNNINVVRHKMSVEVNGADPGNDYRWYLLLPPTATQVLLVLASTNGGYNAHIVIKLFHSICFDISSAEKPY
jgi:hypothetical protein